MAVAGKDLAQDGGDRPGGSQQARGSRALLRA
jgi:hypothetical protein